MNETDIYAITTILRNNWRIFVQKTLSTACFQKRFRRTKNELFGIIKCTIGTFIFSFFVKDCVVFRPRGSEMIDNIEIGFTKLSDRMAIMVGPVPKSSAVKITEDFWIQLRRRTNCTHLLGCCLYFISLFFMEVKELNFLHGKTLWNAEQFLLRLQLPESWIIRLLFRRCTTVMTVYEQTQNHIE